MRSEESLTEHPIADDGTITLDCSPMRFDLRDPKAFAEMMQHADDIANSANVEEWGMPNVEDAIGLALHAHRGQTDKGGAPYILHPLRIMAHMDSEEAQLVAVLHDVVEDTKVTLDDLRADGYSDAVVQAVDALTRRQGETYAEFIERLKPNPLARRVKLADLKDNMNLGRIPNPTEDDLARLDKYRAAWALLAEPSEADQPRKNTGVARS